MKKRLNDVKIAVLVANGFYERDMTECQRALLAEGANVRVVSLDQGLVNSWHGKGWGHHFAVDYPLGTSLAADFDMLLVPGGARSVEKLKQTAHTRRFINGFMSAGKRIVMVGEGVDLLFFAGLAAGRNITGDDALDERASESGAIWQGESLCMDGNLLTARIGENEDIAPFIGSMLTFFAEGDHLMSAAA